jgi:hypothetical protein
MERIRRDPFALALRLRASTRPATNAVNAHVGTARPLPRDNFVPRRDAFDLELPDALALLQASPAQGRQRSITPARGIMRHVGAVYANRNLAKYLKSLITGVWHN